MNNIWPQNIHRCSLAMMAISCAQQIQAQRQTVGFVLDLSGEWVIDGRQIQRGQALPAASNVRAGLTVKTDKWVERHITIILLNNEVLARSCSTSELCAQPIHLPVSVTTPSSFLARLSEAALRLFSRGPDRYAPTMSRGSRNNLQEAVVELGTDRILLSTVFANMPQGSYRLELQSLNQHGSDRIRVIDFEWKSNGSLRVATEGISPGLYKLGILDRFDEPTGTEAWILISRSEDYPAFSAAFQEATDLTHQWSDQVPASAIRSFLRACLEHISAQ